jgi:hypothetical protein
MQKIIHYKIAFTITICSFVVNFFLIYFCAQFFLFRLLFQHEPKQEMVKNVLQPCALLFLHASSGQLSNKFSLW